MSTSDEWAVWIAVAAGIVTGFATAYGMYREWQTYRQNQTQRLTNAAAVAVRRAEANVVRPLLRDRMAATVKRFVELTTTTDERSFRTLLFCELHTGMRLTEEEKRLAHVTATNHLIDILRSVPAPPLRVHNDRQVSKHNGLLQELVENAYSQRMRPSVDLLQQLALFTGITGVPVPSPAT